MTREERFKMNMIDEFKQMCEIVEKYGRIIVNKQRMLKALEQEPKTGHCKDCKYFEYDSVAKVDGVPLIVAHEICNKWGDGCKTSEDGYCYLFEQQESEVRNEHPQR